MAINITDSVATIKLEITSDYSQTGFPTILTQTRYIEKTILSIKAIGDQVVLFDGETNYSFLYTDITTPVGGSAIIVAGLIEAFNDTTATVVQKVNYFRLSLTTATPVTTADVTYSAAQTLYATTYNGNTISLYDGTSWVNYNSSEFSLALGTLTNVVGYDVFCYANSGVPTLEFLAWTNSTARATNLVYQDGILVKSGATTRRYLGSFYNAGNQAATVTITNASPAVITYTAHGLPANAPIVFTTTGGLPTGLTAGTTYYVALIGTSAANTFNVSATPGGALINTSSAGSGVHTGTVPTYIEDSLNNRFLFNYYNSVARPLLYVPTANWDYTSSTASGWYGNAVAAAANDNAKLRYFIGIVEDVVGFNVTIGRRNTNATDIRSNIGIGINSPTSISPGGKTTQSCAPSGLSYLASSTSFCMVYPSLGLSYALPIHSTVATGTFTWDFSTARFEGIVKA